MPFKLFPPAKIVPGDEVVEKWKHFWHKLELFMEDNDIKAATRRKVRQLLQRRHRAKWAFQALSEAYNSYRREAGIKNETEMFLRLLSREFTMLRLFCLMVLAGFVLGDTVSLNKLVDQLLAGLNTELARTGKDTIPIEEMNNQWKYRWHFLRLSGHCNCRGGYARSLASLKRTGDVSMTTNGNAATLKFALGFGKLEFGFRHCQFKAKHLFSVSQRVDAIFSSNSIEAQVTLVKEGADCTATVDHIGLADLGKIKMKAGGRGLVHKMEDKLLNWLVCHFHGNVVAAINHHLRAVAAKNIGKFNLCDRRSTGGGH